MKRYFTKGKGDENPHILELGEEIIKLNDRTSNTEFKVLSKDTLFLRIDNVNYLFSRLSEEENMYNISVNGKNYTVECKSPLDIIKEKFNGNGSGRKKSSEILSPMPGAVVKLAVSEGDRVNKGDVLLVLEAMKMENEIKANDACTVQKILIKEKQSVDKGQLLIQLSFEN